ncbi:hypothetical protein IFO70_35425 [Phormidium tenue FACHB-886]|nr:hypothetical protein [Phormidium tenue FACHB-886]
MTAFQPLTVKVYNNITIPLLHKPNLAHFAFPFDRQLLGKNGSKAPLPIPDCLMDKLEPSQSEESCNISKTQLVAESTQQNLKDDIGRYLDKVEGGTRPFITGAMTPLAARPRLGQFVVGCRRVG